jgi:hypothetical protein
MLVYTSYGSVFVGMVGLPIGLDCVGMVWLVCIRLDGVGMVGLHWIGL